LGAARNGEVPMASVRGEVDASHARLRESFAAGDIVGARRAVLQLTPEAREALEARIGTQAFERMLRTSRGVRSAPRGRVVVIHGIMGGKLAAVDVNDPTDEDLVWISYRRLIEGRIARFQLDANAAQVDQRYRIETRGPVDEYMPLVFDLSNQWDVLPVGFDWRLDIDISARRLDEQIRGWAQGEPVHIVAHSMGGLVSRRFIRNFAQTWAAMKDGDGLKRGGRLVMLGTPNRGSFAIPFVLTGEEKTVKWLALADVQHDLRELLDIINTFPGSYQMLPSPMVPVNDDRLRLYEAATWGRFPVPQKYLDLGRLFQQEMHAVQDAERLIYIAGYGQETPHRVRVDGPGRLSYQTTLDGDGRVPHQLGLLPGVPTYYVDEKHGALPSNEHVMAALHELLASGTTTQLPNARPVSRAVPAEAVWKTAEQIGELEGPIPEGKLSLRSARSVDPRRAAQVEAAIAASFSGSGGAEGARISPVAGAKTARGHPPRKQPASTIDLEVMWADIAQVDGEVIACGHYEGVEPQAGELALDKAISGVAENETFNPANLIITSQTKRGIVRGSVGDINFFPWWQRKQTIAIAGMGRPGTFGVQSLRRTTRSLAQSVAPLPSVKTVSTVLIGSGNGNLDLDTAVGSMVEGLVDALDDSMPVSSVRRIRIVEWELRKAQRIHEALLALRTKVPPGIRIVAELQKGPGGAIGDEIAMSAMLLATAWREVGVPSAASKAAKAVLRGVAATPELRQSCEEVLQRLSQVPRGDLLAEAGRLDLARRPSIGSTVGLPPTRVSFVRDPSGMRAAAISDTAVVTERVMRVDWKLVGEIVGSMTDPHDCDKAGHLAHLMRTLFVPTDFHDRLGMGDRVIVEVDRDTAQIQWEMIESFRKSVDVGTPLCLDRPVARQLRTTYSPAPPPGYVPPQQLRALVIGDPGDPEKGLSLEGARTEALEIAQLLRSRGVLVELRVGAANVERKGVLRGVEPATVLDVLRLLDNNDYDILHFAGHGNFDPEDPEQRAGWIFDDRYFTSRELASISRIPSLVVANACLSGLTSNVSRAGALLPGLVDEFFRRGVRNYVGTAWPISDTGAVIFSNTLYDALLPTSGAPALPTLGKALLDARLALKAREASFGALWAAYQHYGDPAFAMRDPNTAALPPPAPSNAGRKRRRRK
jgi:hypothetical protein